MVRQRIQFIRQFHGGWGIRTFSTWKWTWILKSSHVVFVASVTADGATVCFFWCPKHHVEGRGQLSDSWLHNLLCALLCHVENTCHMHRVRTSTTPPQPSAPSSPAPSSHPHPNHTTTITKLSVQSGCTPVAITARTETLAVGMPLHVDGVSGAARRRRERAAERPGSGGLSHASQL